MDEFVLGLNSQDQTEATLLKALSVKRVDGSSMTSDYLDSIKDYNEEIASDCAKNLIFALLNIGDRLILKSDQLGGFMALPRNGASDLPSAMRQTKYRTANLTLYGFSVQVVVKALQFSAS